METPVDAREVQKAERHPLILAEYDRLSVGDSILLTNDHDPKHLRDDFEREMPGSYGWEYRERGPVWRVLITKLAATPLPRVIGDTSALETADASTGGAVWKLEHTNRDLDSNLIRLPADGRIEEYAGPDIDVLIVVLSGSGVLRTKLEPVELAAGQLVWLPRRSRRGFEAGPDGLGYLTVHQKRKSLLLGTPSRAAANRRR